MVTKKASFSVSVGDRRRRLSVAGKNKTKTLVWSKIFGFVYFEMKMDTTVNGA